MDVGGREIELVVSCLQRVQARNGRAESCRSLEMQRMRIVRGGAAVNRCVSVSSLKLLNNLQLFSIENLRLRLEWRKTF